VKEDNSMNLKIWNVCE